MGADKNISVGPMSLKAAWNDPLIAAEFKRLKLIRKFGPQMASGDPEWFRQIKGSDYPQAVGIAFSEELRETLGR